MRRDKGGKKEQCGVEEENNQRIVIIRGPSGEVVVDSSSSEDSLESIARIAREQYEQGRTKEEVSYIR